MASVWLRVTFYMVYLSGYVLSLSKTTCEQDLYFDKYIRACQPCVSLCSLTGSVADCHTYCQATCDRLLGAGHTQDSTFVQCYQRPTALAAVTSKRSASRATMSSPVVKPHMPLKSSNSFEDVMSGLGIDSDEDDIDIDGTYGLQTKTNRVPHPKNSDHILAYVLGSFIGVLVISNIVTLVILLRVRKDAKTRKANRANLERKSNQTSDNHPHSDSLLHGSKHTSMP